jgi:hypothetical protein
VPEEDRSYYYDRAEAEIKAAQDAAHPKAVNAHYLLAGYYLDLTYNPAGRSAPAETAGEA